MASISGSVTIAGDPDDWIAVAWDADTHAYAGVAAVSGGAYEITGLTAGKAYVVGCRPKSGPVWAAERTTAEGDYTLPSDPITTPYLFRATDAAAGDALAEAIALLLHCDGTDGGVTFTDSSLRPKTITVSGHAHIETDQKVFGTASAAFDGTGDYLSVPGHDDFAFGTGDFAIELWLRQTVVGSSNRDIITWGANWGIYTSPDGTIFVWNGSGNAITSSAGTIVADTWQHIAVTRASGSIKLFVDGVQKGSTVTGNTTNFTNTQTFYIGYYPTNSRLNGYIDEVRVVKGNAIYSSAFTVPDQAFTYVGPSKTGVVEPTWPTTPGNTVVDGDVTWTNMGQFVRPLMHGPLVAA